MEWVNVAFEKGKGNQRRGHYLYISKNYKKVQNVLKPKKKRLAMHFLFRCRTHPILSASLSLCIKERHETKKPLFPGVFFSFFPCYNACQTKAKRTGTQPILSDLFGACKVKRNAHRVLWFGKHDIEHKTKNKRKLKNPHFIPTITWSLFASLANSPPATLMWKQKSSGHIWTAIGQKRRAIPAAHLFRSVHFPLSAYFSPSCCLVGTWGSRKRRREI